MEIKLNISDSPKQRKKEKNTHTHIYKHTHTLSQIYSECSKKLRLNNYLKLFQKSVTLLLDTYSKITQHTNNYTNIIG